MSIRSFILFFLFQITSAQEFSFVGEVYSNKQPLEGVSVILKGSNLGTITNSKGQFELLLWLIIIISLNWDHDVIISGSFKHNVWSTRIKISG